jgi:hypothetical protein
LSHSLPFRSLRPPKQNHTTHETHETHVKTREIWMNTARPELMNTCANSGVSWANSPLDFLVVIVVVCMSVIEFMCYSIFQTSNVVSDVSRVRFCRLQVCKFQFSTFRDWYLSGVVVKIFVYRSHEFVFVVCRCSIPDLLVDRFKGRCSSCWVFVCIVSV